MSSSIDFKLTTIFLEEAREWFQLKRMSINNSKIQHLLCTMKKVDTIS